MSTTMGYRKRKISCPTEYCAVVLLEKEPNKGKWGYFNNFRPIVLLNAVLKILHKMSAKRLAFLIGILVGEVQT